jgi:hypothetical protein
MNPTLVAFAGTVTVPGTVTAELLLDRFTLNPPPGAAAVSVTVHATVAAPTTAPLLQDSALSAAGASGAAEPVPLRLTTAVLLVDELLVMVSCPVAAPGVVGLKPMFSVIAWPGFNVTGNVPPEIVKPAPVTTAALTVTGAAPEEVMVTGWGVAAVFTCTLPNATLAGLMLSVGTAAFNCSAKVLERPPALAVIVTA